MQAALEYRTIPSRFHMLLLRKHLNMAHSNTPQVSQIEPPPTANLPAGDVIDGPSTLNMTSFDWPVQHPGPTCMGNRPLVAYRTQILGLLYDQPIVLDTPEVHSNGTLAPTGFATLAFAYTRNALVVPGTDSGQLTFQNLMLRELPQGGTPQQLSATAELPHMLPPEAWTILLFAVNR